MQCMKVMNEMTKGQLGRDFFMTLLCREKQARNHNKKTGRLMSLLHERGRASATQIFFMTFHSECHNSKKKKNFFGSFIKMEF